MRAALGPDDTTRAIEDLRVGHVALSSFSTVADLRVLSIGATGIRAGREFEPGEAWSDHERQLSSLLGLAEDGGVVTQYENRFGALGVAPEKQSE